MASVLNQPTELLSGASLSPGSLSRALNGADTTAEFLDLFLNACHGLSADERLAVTVRVMHHSFFDGVELGKLLGISDRNLIPAMLRKDVHRNRPKFRETLIHKGASVGTRSKIRSELHMLARNEPQKLDGAELVSTASVRELNEAADLFYSRLYKDRKFRMEDPPWALNTSAVERGLSYIEQLRSVFSATIGFSSFVDGVWKEIMHHPRFEQAVHNAWRESPGNKSFSEFRREVIDPGLSAFPGQAVSSRADTVAIILGEPLPQTIDQQQLARFISKLGLSPEIEEKIWERERASRLCPLSYYADREVVIEALKAQLHQMLKFRQIEEFEINKDLERVYQVKFREGTQLSDYDWNNPVEIESVMPDSNDASKWDQLTIPTIDSVLRLYTATGESSQLYDLITGQRIESEIVDHLQYVNDHHCVAGSLLLLCEMDSAKLVLIELDRERNVKVLLKNQNDQIEIRESIASKALIKGEDKFYIFDKDGLHLLDDPLLADDAVLVGDTVYFISGGRLFNVTGEEINLPGSISQNQIVRTSDGALVAINNVVYRLVDGEVTECFRSEYKIKLCYGANDEAIILESRELDSGTAARFFSPTGAPVLGGRAFQSVGDINPITPTLAVLQTSLHTLKFVDYLGTDLATIGDEPNLLSSRNVSLVDKDLLVTFYDSRSVRFRHIAQSAYLLPAEQAVLDLINVIASPALESIDSVIEKFKHLRPASPYDGSQVAVKFLIETLRKNPELFADDLIAIKENSSNILARLSWILPDHFEDSRTVTPMTRYRGSTNEYFLALDQAIITSGDPNEYLDYPFRVLPNISGFFVTNCYDRCESTGVWHVSSIREAKSKVKSGEETIECILVVTNGGGMISLPYLAGSSITEVSRSGGVDESGRGYLTLHGENRVRNPLLMIGSAITYKLRISEQEPLFEISNSEYADFRARLIKEYGSFLCEPLIKVFPMEMQRVLDRIASFPPLEKLREIQRWVLSVQYYDMDNGSLIPNKDLLSSRERLEQMMLRARQLRIRGFQEAKGKLFAGVCIDFARDLTLNLCRAAGLATGVAVGLYSDPFKNTHRPHAEAYVYWPDPDGAIRRYYLKSTASSAFLPSEETRQYKTTNSDINERERLQSNSKDLQLQKPLGSPMALAFESIDFSIADRSSASIGQQPDGSVPALEYLFEIFLAHAEIRIEWLENSPHWQKSFTDWIWHPPKLDLWDDKGIAATIARYEDLFRRVLGEGLALRAMQACVDAADGILSPDLKRAFEQIVVRRN